MGDRVHRRALLALSALVPLARCQRDRRIPRPTLVPAPGAHEQGAARDSGARAERDASRADVIILGAGLAGLRAAEVLASERLSVVVLEARERVGGRVHTHRAWGGSVELGASVIRGLGYDPVASRATAMGLDVRPCDDSYRLLTTEGRELSERRRQRWMTQARELARRARERLGPAEDMPLRVAFERALDDPRVSEEERAGLAWAIRATIERPRAASVDALSLASFEDGGERVGNAGRVTAGLSTLVERMASSLRVERSNPARSIAHSAEGVEVRAERGLWRGPRRDRVRAARRARGGTDRVRAELTDR